MLGDGFNHYSVNVNQKENGAAVFIPAKDKADLYGKNHIFRTCAYCRVSTDNDAQLSSFELQQEHYQNLADAHPNWELKHIFADEGISGTSQNNRVEFRDMIDRCFKGEFNLIVTKSVSRFARNLVDCVSLARQLKALSPPVGIFFETDNLFTLSEDSELKLSLLATFAQEESVKKSESMNWSLRERFKNKKLLTTELFGYRRPRDAFGNYIKYGKLEIEESEAEIVRFIYNAFLSGFSIESICGILEEIGCKTKLGNTTWSEGSVGYILRNERYCGNVLTWKQFTCDIFEHKKRKNRLNRDQYLYTDVHEAIVTPEQFDAVQVLLNNKRHGYRGGVPLMQVVDNGALCGYVPINHHWVNADPESYYTASNSVAVYKQSNGKVRKRAFSCFDLSGYQVVRGQFLTARTELPMISFNNEKISFNCSCIRKFFQAGFVQLLLHPVERKIAIRPCSKTDAFSIPWHKNPEQPMVSKIISCPHFCNALFQIMNWEPDYGYKVLGTLIEKGNEQMVVFNLDGAVPNMTVCEKDEKTDSVVKKRVMICPEEWGDTFGEEFYDFSLENALYYSSNQSDMRISEKSKPVEGQLSFSIMSGNEVMQFAQRLKNKAGNDIE